MIEILIVVVIIGILAAIAIPSLTRQRQKGYDATAMSDIKNAYTQATAYFDNYPDATVTLAKLRQAGFRSSSGVVLTVLNGSEKDLSFTATHKNGGKTFSVSAGGIISE